MFWLFCLSSVIHRSRLRFLWHVARANHSNRIVGASLACRFHHHVHHRWRPWGCRSSTFGQLCDALEVSGPGGRLTTVYALWWRIVIMVETIRANTAAATAKENEKRRTARELIVWRPWKCENVKNDWPIVKYEKPPKNFIWILRFMKQMYSTSATHFGQRYSLWNKVMSKSVIFAFFRYIYFCNAFASCINCSNVAIFVLFWFFFNFQLMIIVMMTTTTVNDNDSDESWLQQSLIGQVVVDELLQQCEQAFSCGLRRRSCHHLIFLRGNEDDLDHTCSVICHLTGNTGEIMYCRCKPCASSAADRHDPIQ